VRLEIEKTKQKNNDLIGIRTRDLLVYIMPRTILALDPINGLVSQTEQISK
jgi:hypothetical protein